ncbi:MAG: protein phosphatase 2C domain-containing protein [Ardenticatenaceae bacterium]|nr:protein phosphatase 2C domain-containing protein [Ardenticatenaceae bacterium]MCB8990453.1 protein phosphatase 2C domain-containing protein [Ardenticatenaceae bacterium]MCB9003467.1 protein phosphatase 2C domain-containing protein [Ardenticatenaceae bacterium]
MKNYDPKLAGGYSDVGPVRKVNQDAFRIPDPTTPTQLGALYIVADGVGGQEHGEVAAKIGVKVAYETFYQARQQDNPIQAALKHALNKANEAVYAEAQERGGGRMGCTMVAVVQHEGMLYVAHVGDARAYLVHDGRLRRMTRDDTWVQKQVEAGILTAEDAAKHELRNVVTQVLGNKPEVDVHLGKPYTLTPDDVLMMCSDGLYDPVSDEQMLQIMAANPPQQASEALIQAAIDGNATDNITAVVVHCGQTSVSPAGWVIPKWLPMVVVGIVLLIAVGAAIAPLLSKDGNDATPPPADMPTPIPTQPLPPVNEGVGGTAVPLQDVQPTSTLAPIATETPLPTETPTATPPPPEPTIDPQPQACIIRYVFVWSDEQINGGVCGQNTPNDLDAGTIVRFTNPFPQIGVEGPGECGVFNNFRKVRGEKPDGTVVEGWVIADDVKPLAAGETCSP